MKQVGKTYLENGKMVFAENKVTGTSGSSAAAGNAEGPERSAAGKEPAE